MSEIYFHRLEILKDLYELVMENVCDNVFVNDRPTAVQESMTEFAVVRLSNSITDRGSTYQDGYAQIYLYAKDKANGIEDTFKLEYMLNGLSARFPIVTPRYTAIKPRLISGGDDTLGFHFLIIQTNLTIKK